MHRTNARWMKRNGKSSVSISMKRKWWKHHCKMTSIHVNVKIWFDFIECVKVRRYPFIRIQINMSECDRMWSKAGADFQSFTLYRPNKSLSKHLGNRKHVGKWLNVHNGKYTKLWPYQRMYMAVSPVQNGWLNACYRYCSMYFVTMALNILLFDWRYVWEIWDKNIWQQKLEWYQKTPKGKGNNWAKRLESRIRASP